MRGRGRGPGRSNIIREVTERRRGGSGGGRGRREGVGRGVRGAWEEGVGGVTWRRDHDGRQGVSGGRGDG